ncbi:MAG: hypothetical protein LBQ83_00845 [Candidatus Margulisbacteria bacterium]|jgi:UDP-N-acetylmuramate dehydrogenase|nr:hypothetical protein [Candidatus Margulisiibacteriota bacterium]
MQSQQSVSLSGLSAIRIGGRAELVYYPETMAEFTELLAGQPELPVVGGGTNVFFGDLPELICTQKLNKITETAAGIEAECGARLAELFDFAAGVPATVGGGVRMNFGAFGYALKDFIISAQVWDSKDQQIKTLTREALRLGYRTSGFYGTVLSALFSGKQLERKAEFFKARQAKMPWGRPNIGSVFKNPPAGQSAGQLIEAAGLKGYVYKDLQISNEHANIIVNNGKASAAELQGLIKFIQTAVREKTGVALTPEIQCPGK